MNKSNTRQFQYNKWQHNRLAWILLSSVLLHVLIIVLLTKSNHTLPVHTGSAFSVSLNEINVTTSQRVTKTENAISPSVQKPDTTKKNKPHQKTITNTTSRETITHAMDTNTAAAQPDSAYVIAHIHHQLKQHFYYPVMAQKRNWQGKVVVNFKINSQGDVKNIQIVQSSGYSILDSAAVTAVGQLRHINTHVNWPNTGMDIKLPVIYQLKEG